MVFRLFDVYVILKIRQILLVFIRLSHENLLERLLTCTCRNGVSADHIFLQTFEVVYAASDGCLAEHLGSLLE